MLIAMFQDFSKTLLSKKRRKMRRLRHEIADYRLGFPDGQILGFSPEFINSSSVTPTAVTEMRHRRLRRSRQSEPA